MTHIEGVLLGSSFLSWSQFVCLFFTTSALIYFQHQLGYPSRQDLYWIKQPWRENRKQTPLPLGCCGLLSAQWTGCHFFLVKSLCVANKRLLKRKIYSDYLQCKSLSTDNRTITSGKWSWEKWKIVNAVTHFLKTEKCPPLLKLKFYLSSVGNSKECPRSY